MVLDQNKAVSRRSFLKAASAGAALATLPVVQSKAQPTQFTWQIVTSWPAGSGLQRVTERFADLVTTMSNGDMTFDIFAGGELVPPASGEFDAVSSGTVQASNSASYYWAGTVPAAQFFTAVPFGFTFDQLMDFILRGGGIELWEEVYEPFGLKPLPLLTTSMQMGGWFNKKINSLDDVQGLNFRIPGLGGKVWSKAGANVIGLPGGEIFTALQTGTIDAAEWVNPSLDLNLGLPQIAQFYYHPGWHEPGVTAEFMMNLDAWNGLPKDIQTMIKTATLETTLWSFAFFEAANVEALVTIRNDFPEVELIRFPDEVLKELKRLTGELFDESSEGDPAFTKVREAVDKFAVDLDTWSNISIESYLPALEL